MSDFKPTISEAVDKLATLGSAAQIAEFFELQGIKGTPYTADSCPVSKFVHRETQIPCVAGDAGVLPTHDRGRSFARGVAFWNEEAQTYDRQYDPVRSFIDNFDGAKYPNLIEKRDS